MHTQTESVKRRRISRQTLPSAIAALVLYLLTISGEVMLGASVRWLCTYLGAATVGLLVPLGLSAEGLAWVAAVAPLAYSALAFILPGQGRLWRRRLGARRPTADEKAAIDDALEVLRGANPSLRDPASLYVLDELLPAALVRGRTVILSRGLLESDALAAILGHELGHVDTLDGRITEALARLALWGDPLGPAQAEDWERRSSFDREGRLLFAFARWTLRLAGGSVSQQLLKPLWAIHWRTREYAADAYAASLGQAEDLARHLAEQELPFDSPRPHTLFDCSEHPPAAHRVERLLASSAATGSE
jgi:Zn-dependent protease with chaperone function